MAERQTGTQLNDIRKDHLERYNFAINKLSERDLKNKVLDAGCGVGYGSFMLSYYVNSVHSIEISNEAYKIYKNSFYRENINFVNDNIFKASLYDFYDAVICFEFIEHIDKAFEALKLYSSVSNFLISSTPNEEIRPWAKKPVNPFHVRHYTPSEYLNMLELAGFKENKFFHQKGGKKPDIHKGTNGKFLIAVSSK